MAKTPDFTDITLAEIAQAHNLMSQDNWETLASWRTGHYNAAATGISSRVINYWVEAGVLDNDICSEHKWHKFSLISLLYIAIIIRLRKFGFSIKQLRQTKKSLWIPLWSRAMPDDKTYIDHSLTLLEFGFIRTIALNGDGNTYLLVADDGSAIIMTERDLHHNRERQALPDTYIYINLNELWGKAFQHHSIKVHQEMNTWLNKSEKIALDNIRTTKSGDKISLKMKDLGLIDNVEIESAGKPTDFSNLHTEIAKLGYGKVELTIQNNKVNRIVKKRTIKVSK